MRKRMRRPIPTGPTRSMRAIPSIPAATRLADTVRHIKTVGHSVPVMLKSSNSSRTYKMVRRVMTVPALKNTVPRSAVLYSWYSASCSAGKWRTENSAVASGGNGGP